MLLEFADPPRLSSPSIKKDTQIERLPLIEDEPVVPLENPPKTLMQWGVLILNTPNPTLKVLTTRYPLMPYSHL